MLMNSHRATGWNERNGVGLANIHLLSSSVLNSVQETKVRSPFEKMKKIVRIGSGRLGRHAATHRAALEKALISAWEVEKPGCGF